MYNLFKTNNVKLIESQLKIHDGKLRNLKQAQDVLDIKMIELEKRVNNTLKQIETDLKTMNDFVAQLKVSYAQMPSNSFIKNSKHPKRKKIKKSFSIKVE